MKNQLVSQITARLRQQLNTMTEAAKATHAAATDQGSKQEGKYDTRAVEASYLAGAQAEQSQSLAHALHIFESLELDTIPPDGEVAPGALVEVESSGTIQYFLLTSCAGGITISHELGEVTTLSPEAPLYQDLLGKQTGDILEDSDMMVLEIS